MQATVYLWKTFDTREDFGRDAQQYEGVRVADAGKAGIGNKSVGRRRLGVGAEKQVA